MSDALHPKDGARLLLMWTGTNTDGTAASYTGCIYTKSEKFDYDAELDMAGTAGLTATGQPAPPELEAKLQNLAKSTARSAKRKLDAELPPWPRRILRWRGPGRG